jgi:hypothetical protein
VQTLKKLLDVYEFLNQRDYLSTVRAAPMPAADWGIFAKVKIGPQV